MKKNSLRKVYSVYGVLQGLAIRDALEKAGIPAATTYAHDHHYIDVLVPEEWEFDARHLLFPDTRSGEIYYGHGLPAG